MGNTVEMIWEIETCTMYIVHVYEHQTKSIRWQDPNKDKGLVVVIINHFHLCSSSSTALSSASSSSLSASPFMAVGEPDYPKGHYQRIHIHHITITIIITWRSRVDLKQDKADPVATTLGGKLMMRVKETRYHSISATLRQSPACLKIPTDCRQCGNWTWDQDRWA